MVQGLNGCLWSKQLKILLIRLFIFYMWRWHLPGSIFSSSSRIHFDEFGEECRRFVLLHDLGLLFELPAAECHPVAQFVELLNQQAAPMSFGMAA